MSTNKWIEMATDDLDSANIMLRERKFNNVCYFSEQAAEKALKGYLVDRRRIPPKIHNLVELLKICQEFDPNFMELGKQARVLNQFYIPTRYPIAPVGSTAEGMPSEQLARKAIEYGGEILEFCQRTP